MKGDSHIISMSGKLLGNWGRAVSWAIYLFMAYLSLTAYISGGGDLFEAALGRFNVPVMPDWALCIAFVLVFGVVIEIGSLAVGKLNAILFAGLLGSYFLLVILGAEAVELKNLEAAHFEHAFLIVPLLLTSFSFQMIVPSLASYLERDAKRLRMAILLGTSISFVIYFVWNMIVLGSVAPENAADLAQLYAEGRPPTRALSGLEKNWFSLAVQYFSFFALVTSFIGIAWGLFDFLADGLSIRKVGMKRLFLWTLVMVPPTILAITYPRGFIGALEATGAYGDTILNGLIPLSMFFVGRYWYKYPSGLLILRSKVSLGLLSLFAFSVLILQIIRNVS
jgi:tyrosine-specific transport protein